jgi:hypothetical protein
MRGWGKKRARIIESVEGEDYDTVCEELVVKEGKKKTKRKRGSLNAVGLCTCMCL